MHHVSPLRFGVLLGTVCLVASCGSKSNEAKGRTDDAGQSASVPPIATPVLGVATLPPWGFLYNEGKKAYDAAQTAYKAKERDWSAVRTHCEAAIAADAEHYDARRLLASALASSGQGAAAADQLAIVLAADFFRYAPGIASDPDLKDFVGTPHGAAVMQLVEVIRAEYTRRIGAGVWLVGRRSAFKWPKDAGAQPASSRGEVYAFDREARRYLRLSHTDHQAVGFVRGGDELAVIGFDRVEKPATPDAPGLIARAWVQVIDTKTWEARKRTTIAGPMRELAAGYGDGNVLLVATSPAQGRWGLGPAVVQAVDGNGKLSPAAVALPVNAIRFTLDEGTIVRLPDKVTAPFAGDPPTAPTLAYGSATVQVPESGQAAGASVTLAPDGAHLAFATAVDPCAKGTAPSLYIADAKGALTHILSARSRFATRWLDASNLAYDDGEGSIRVWDVAANREALKITNASGIALAVLSATPGAICKGSAAPAIEVDLGSAAGGSGSDEMPPEE